MAEATEAPNNAAGNSGIDEREWPVEMANADTRLHLLAQILSDAARSPDRSADAEVFTVLAEVAGYHLDLESHPNPYRPMFELAGQRSPIPGDLSPEQIDTLREVAPAIPHSLLRSRALDVVSLLSSGRERMERAVASVEALAIHLSEANGPLRERTIIRRAIEVARMFGQPAAQHLGVVEAHIRSVALDADDPSESLAAADLLMEYRLARADATAVANRLAALAEAAEGKSELERGLRNGAATWFSVSGDEAKATEQHARSIRSLIAESDAIAKDNPARALHLCEEALASLRRMSRADRATHGLETLDDGIRERRTALSSAVIRNMNRSAFTGPDIGAWIAETQERLQNRDALDALLVFALGHPLADYQAELERAREVLAEHPISALFPTRHFSSDGRTVKQTPPEGVSTQYGVDAQVWRQMLTANGIRVQLVVQGHVVPGLQVLLREHTLDRAAMQTIAAGSPFVPPGNEGQFAVGLLRGFAHDFISAVHVLTPQIENMVRFHLKQQGVATTTVDEDHVENEVGLSALAKKDEFVALLGEDLAFEIRALMCDPLGANLRNEVAHGLMSDAAAQSTATVYLWWLALRLAVSGYKQALDAQAESPNSGGDNAGVSAAGPRDKRPTAP